MEHLLPANQLNPQKAFGSSLYRLKEPTNCGSLSNEDIPKLRGVCEQAPFGKGLATLVDTKVRRCWQVDGSKVSFPGASDFLLNTIQPLAMRAVHALGLDGARVQVEAHCCMRRVVTSHSTGTLKRTGMFGTLILQFLTEEGYEGGKLVVKHYNAVQEFDCRLVSSLGICYTILFADCLHELRKIESGVRVCLVFSYIYSTYQNIFTFHNT